MKIQEIRELIKLVDDSSIDEFEYEHDGQKLIMKKGGEAKQQFVESPSFEEKAMFSQPAEAHPKAVPRPEPSASDESNKDETPAKAEQQEDTDHLHKIESPMVGTFYLAPSPEAGPYVEKGDKVDDSTVVCIVEAMKLFNEIEAEVKGDIVEILVENGELVEYGQPLFLVKPE